MNKLQKIVFVSFTAAVVLAAAFFGKMILASPDSSAANYIVVLFAVFSISLIIAAGWIFFNVKKFSPEKIFIVFFALIGLFYIVSVPFPNATDESAHFLRLYELSKGHLVSAFNDGNMGRELPSNLNFQPNSFKGVASNLHLQISNQNEWIYFPNTASASFATYALYLPGLWTAKLATNNFFATAYLIRISVFIFAGIILFFALKIMPFKKNLLFVLMGAPIVFRAMTAISGDMMLNILSFLLVSLLFYWTVKLEKIEVKHIALFALLMLLLSLCKTPVYTPFVLLFLLLPVSKFKSTKSYMLYFAGIVLLTAAVSALWLYATKGITDAYALMQNKNAGGNEQIKYILTHHFNFIVLVAKTYILHAVEYIGSYAGIGWGYINQKINFVLVFLYIFALTTVSLSETVVLHVKQRSRLARPLFYM